MLSAANNSDCRKEAEMQSKLTICYSRLSREDGEDNLSNSIKTQREMLETYAEQNGFTPYRHITDDGFSGKDFSRPGWQELMTEIDAGNVARILLKSMDRMGRNYLQVGLYRELFRERGVQLIAVNDNYDSVSGEGDEFMPFKDIMSEWYIRDCSRKTKSAFKTKGMSGRPMMSTAPYGYLKDPNDKNKWLVDHEAAAIVKRIFQMTMDGMGPYQICCQLESDKVYTPGYHLKLKGAGLHQNHDFPNPYHWSSSCVCAILKKKEYLGHTVNFKSTKNSYKDKKNHYVPESQWLIFENTHEQIIDQVTFDNVQRIRGNIKRRPDGYGYVHPLSGLVFCATCGAKLYCHRIYNGKDSAQYVCGNSTKIKDGHGACTSHRIAADVLMELIAETLRRVTKFAKTDNAEFVKRVQETLTAQQSDGVKAQRKRLKVCRNRVTELETLFTKIYEDNALGKLDDKRFAAMSEKYSAEQTALENEIAELSSAVEHYEGGKDRADKFMTLVKKYEDFTELSNVMLNEFVEKIVVHERDLKGKIDSTQTVEIHLNFIGEFEIPFPESDPAEIAVQEEERRKILERRERLHQNYLKRKASGAQQAWEKKYEPKRKARYAEKRAALFTKPSVNA